MEKDDLLKLIGDEGPTTFWEKLYGMLSLFLKASGRSRENGH